MFEKMGYMSHYNFHYIFGAETHLAAGDMSAFVFPSATIAWVLALTFLKCPRKDSDYTDMFTIMHSDACTC